MRRELKYLGREQSGQRYEKSQQRDGEQHIADEPRMTAHVEFIHGFMPPPDAYFYKQKLLSSP